MCECTKVTSCIIIIRYGSSCAQQTGTALALGLCTLYYLSADNMGQLVLASHDVGAQQTSKLS